METPNIHITPEILNIIASIDEFKGEWAGSNNLPQARMLAMKKAATIQAIGAACRTDGAAINNEEVHDLLARGTKELFDSHAQEEAWGYNSVLEQIFSLQSYASLSEELIKNLYVQLFSQYSINIGDKNDYKKSLNQFEAFNNKGESLGILFDGEKPEDVPSKVKSLLEWTHSELQKQALHPLLVISIFMLYFQAIQPFEHGNSKLSNLLVYYLLMKCGYSYMPYTSLELQFEENSKKYFFAIMRAQRTIHADNSMIGDWVLFFLYSLKLQKDNLIRKISEASKMQPLAPLAIEILDILKEHGQATISDICTLTDANRNTVKVRLRNMVGTKQLCKHGKGKGTRYTVCAGT